jgi:hypothetical protein
MTYEMNRLATEVAEILERNISGAWSSELELSDAVEHVLAAVPSVVCAREFVLGTSGRLDFIVTSVGYGGGPLLLQAPDCTTPIVAIEVKINGSIAQLTRQIDRYLAHDRVGGVIVVTTRMALLRLPSALRMKPIRGCLIRGGL